MLTILDFSDQALSLDEVRRIAAHLANSTQVTSLFIANTGLGDEGLSLLSAALYACPSLTRLYMGHNKISPKGAAKLSAALAFNTSLELLNLTNNNLGKPPRLLASPGFDLDLFVLICNERKFSIWRICKRNECKWFSHTQQLNRNL